MNNIITYNFSVDFIEKLSLYVYDNFYKKNKDLSRIAIVFGGKRPALFLKRALAKKIKTDFISPCFYSIDEFMNCICNKNERVGCIRDLEAAYYVYRIAKNKVSPITRTRDKFSQFLPWAREIISFIDQLDLENIQKERLINIGENAQIGYEVPKTINKLLENIVYLREVFHEKMQQDKKYSRGLIYLTAANIVSKIKFKEFEKIFFCSFFDLHETEKTVIKHFYAQGNAILFFQKDENKSLVFDDLSKTFDFSITPEPDNIRKADVNLYAGFDTHSQVGIIRNLLADMSDEQKNKTVIVLPNAENVIPLLSEISALAQDYNVSMGYPVIRSTLYGLFNAINRAQKTRKQGQYYTQDYLALIRHPVMKNILIVQDLSVTRVLVHKIEEVLTGMLESEVSGSLFVDLAQIENLEGLYELVAEQLKHIGILITAEDFKKVLTVLHEWSFRNWEKINTLGQFSKSLKNFLDILLEKSLLSNYPLNNKVIQNIYGLCDDFLNQAFAGESFQNLEIFRIFDDFLRSEKIAFTGMPLRGLQILGLLETRAISFENVIIMDVNESILPRLSVNEPLIPRAVMVSLGLDRLEEEERIQRYQFMRLIKAAKKAHLIFNNNPDMQKSRFIEEILWEQEKEDKKIYIPSAPRAMFNCEVLQEKGFLAKDENTRERLENFVFSASSINTYLNCPMQFYYKYILGLSEKEDLLDELESKEVGTFIHELLEDSFKPFLGKIMIIDESFRYSLIREFERRFIKTFTRRMKSDAFMLKQIMRFRLEKFLDNEAQRKGVRIEALEQEIMKTVQIKGRKVKLKCRIDRIDRIDARTILVLDYKTGSNDSLPQGIKVLEKTVDDPTRTNIRKAVRSFQMPLYLYCVQDEYPNLESRAALYNIRKIALDKFPKDKEIDQRDRIMGYCLELLREIITQIYDPQKDFSAEKKDDLCKYCPFISLCN